MERFVQNTTTPSSQRQRFWALFILDRLFGRMVMCHMLADSDEELHAMAQSIGVARHWHQKAGTVHSHYDICLSKRALAVQLGAHEITMKQVGELIAARRAALKIPLFGPSRLIK